MNTMINVARYHLVQPVLFVALPLAMLAFLFAVNAARGGSTWRDGLAVIFLYFFIMGVQRAGGRWLPFGLTLGATRRSFLRWYRAARGVTVPRLRPGDSRAAGHRAGDRRLGTVHRLIPGAVSPERGIAVAFARAWSGVGGPHPGLSALGLAGAVAALTVVILAGGHATIRRATV